MTGDVTEKPNAAWKETLKNLFYHKLLLLLLIIVSQKNITMNCLFTSLIVALTLLVSVSSSSSSSLSFARNTASRASLFGISRGGGLFGGKDDGDKSDDNSAAGAAVAAAGDKKMYSAMSQDEIEDWLEHIPVFAVTDSNGAGVVLKPDDDSSVFYFFLNPLAANATLTQLKSVNESMDLKVSAFCLGKVWFKLLNGDADREVLVSLLCRRIVLLAMCDH